MEHGNRVRYESIRGVQDGTDILEREMVIRLGDLVNGVGRGQCNYCDASYGLELTGARETRKSYTA